MILAPDQHFQATFMPNVEMNRHGTPIRRAFFIALTLMMVAACGGGASSGSAIDVVPVATLLRPTPDGYAFANFPASVSPEEFNTDDLVKMFGAEACTGGVEAACEPIAEAAAWARMVNQARQSGHCEGIVVEASKRFNLSLLPQTVELVNEGEVTHQILRTFGTQFLPEVQEETIGWQKKSLSAIVAELVDSFKTGKPKYSMGLYVEQGGHALLPYAVEFPSPELARIQLYDSNWPGKNRYVDVDLKAKKWQFSFSGEDPANDPDAWTGGEGDMDLTSLDTRSNSSCPFCANKTKVKNSMIVISSVDRNWSVTTDKGIYSPSSDRLVDGLSARPIRGSAEVPPIVKDVPPPIRYYMRNNFQSFEYVVFVEGKNIKLQLPSTTSAFVSQGSAIVQLSTTSSSDNRTVSISNNSVSVDDPTVNVKVASGDLVAEVAGNNSTIGIADKQLNISVETSTGRKIEVVVNENTPAVSAKTSKDGLNNFVVQTQTADDSLVVREIAEDGSEVVETRLNTKLTELDETGIDLPEELRKSDVKPGLPPLESRDLTNPDYKADETFMPTEGLLVSKLAEQMELSNGVEAAVKNRLLEDLVSNSVSGTVPSTTTTTTTVPTTTTTTTTTTVPTTTTTTTTTTVPTTTTTTTTIPPTTPLAPTIGVITPSSGSLSVAFTAGSDGGSAITSYKYSTDGGATFRTRAAGTTASPIVISTLSSNGTTVLTNGTTYSIQLKAVNAIGDGAATSSATGKPASVPAAPASNGMTALNASLSVVITHYGNSGGSAITSWKYSTDGGVTFRTRTDGGTTSQTLVIAYLSSDGVTPLENDTAYSIQTKAVNAIGDSSATTSTSATPSAALWGAGGNTVVDLNWTGPASFGGAAITDYVIQYSSNSGSTWSTFADGTSTTTKSTVTGLTNDTSYLFGVAAVSSAGTGTYSVTGVAVTPNTCSIGGVCALSNIGPGGGTVFYVASSNFASIGSGCGSDCVYLEAAPTGWVTSPAGQSTRGGGTSFVDPRTFWNDVSNREVGATAQGTAIGTGYANTSANIAYSSTAGYAATLSRAYLGGGKSDWFLPSMYELNQLCRFAWNLSINNSSTTCSGMTGALRGGFQTGGYAYWSSTENGFSSAYQQTFVNGAFYATGKNVANWVRPVRAFSQASG